jgi:hypothetical protein
MAAQAARMLKDEGRRSFRRLWVGPFSALALLAGLAWLAPGSTIWAAPWLLLWLASPEIARRISRPAPALGEQLDEASIRRLRRVARRTWLFFETFVGPHDHWLPIDHFQEHPRGVPAHRTSPTNIGMLLLSELAAYDLGYLGVEGLASWISNSLDTIERLERHRGHTDNWATPLRSSPRGHVSTVTRHPAVHCSLSRSAVIGCVVTRRSATDMSSRDTAEPPAEAVAHWAEASGAGPARALGFRTPWVELLDGGTACNRTLPLQYVESRGRRSELLVVCKAETR